VNDDDGNDLSAVPVPPDERSDLFGDLELTAGTGAYVWEPGRRLLWSEGFFRLLGIDRDSNAKGVRGSAFFDRVHPEDRAQVREHWAKALNGDPRPTRYRIVRPDGELRYLRGQGSVTRQRDGVPERIVGTIVDVTDVQKAIEELSRTHTLLEVIASAGGHRKATANLSNTILVRRVGGDMKQWRLDADVYQWGKEPPIWLQPRDIVFVPNTAIDDVNIWVDK
jgi:PAS domain S-box-containing protein